MAAVPVGSGPAPVVSRTTSGDRMPLAAASLLRSVQRMAGEDGAEDVGDGEESPAIQRSVAGAGAARPLPLPHLPVARSLHDATSAGSPARVASSAGAPATSWATSAIAGSPASSNAAGSSSAAASSSVQRSQATPEIRPIAGANPLRLATLQRAASDEDAGDDEGDAPGLPSPWWSTASERPAAGATAAFPAASGLDGAAAVQRSAASSSMPSRTAAPALIAAARSEAGSARLSAASVQRSSRGATPTQLPLAIPSGDAGRQQATGATAAAPSGPSISFPSAGIVGGPVVQTSPSSHGSPSSSQAQGGSPLVQRAESPSSWAPSGGQDSSDPERSERDLDELAKALFGRIRKRLRIDLLHDREAAGFTFDNV